MSALAIAFAEDEGILATLPPDDGAVTRARCFLRQNGPFCGYHEAPLQPMLASRNDRVANTGVAVFVDAYAEAQAAQVTGATPRWDLSSNLLKSLIAAGAPSGSIVAVDMRPGEEAVLWVEPSADRQSAECVTTLGIAPANPAVPALRTTIQTLSHSGDCRQRLTEAIVAVVQHDQSALVASSIRTLHAQGAATTEVYVGPNVSWLGKPYLEVAVLGSRPLGVVRREVLLTLAHPGLPAGKYKQLAAITAPAQYQGETQTRAGREAFMQCFLKRSCPGPRDRISPLGFF